MLLAIPALFGCERRETPLAGSGHGLGPEGKPICSVVVEIPPEADIPAIHGAAAVWQAEAGPRIRLRRVAYTTSSEDGRFQLGFGVPGAHCRHLAASGAGATCLGDGQEGVTQLRQDEEGNVFEADLVLSRELLSQPVRLHEVVLHEFGHLLGLGHPRTGASGPDAELSIMTNPAPEGAERPGRADLRALKRAYGDQCR